MFDDLFKPEDILQKGLTAAWQRNAVIRNNIANVETPGFKASDVEFESLLARAIEEDAGGFGGVATHRWHINGSGFKGARTHPKHISIGSPDGVDPESINPRVVKRSGLSMRMDGNNVDIEDENVKLAQNSLNYNALLEKMNGEIRRLRMAINEGR